MVKKFFVIDGHSQMYRAYYAPFRELTSPAGEPTRATYVFTNMLLKFIDEHKPDYLAMAIDGPREKLKRTELYGEYKAHRQPTPEDFKPQEQRIMQIVGTMGIPVVHYEGYEADDVLATIAKKFAGNELEVVLVSRDKDLDQLVSENVQLYDPMKDEFIDAAAIEAAKGYPPSKAIEVQTLMGDPTDNIPGVPGVGPKTAVKLIEKYGSADAVLAAADEQTPKLCENLKNLGEKGIEISRMLVTLDTHVPMKETLGDFSFHTPDYSKLGEIFAELGFSKLVDKYAPQVKATSVKPAAQKPAPAVKSVPKIPGGLFDSLEETPAPLDEKPAAEKKPSVEVKKEFTPRQPGELTTAADFNYELIDTPQGLAELAKRLVGVKRIAVDTETTGVKAMSCSLVGVCLSWQTGAGVYLPVRGPLGATLLELDDVKKILAPILADESVEKVGHNLKYDLIVLENAGFTVRGKMFDTMIAAYVLDSSHPSLKMDYLSMEYLNHRCIPITDLIGTGRNQITMNAVPTDTVAVYAAEDADVTLRLADAITPKLHWESLDGLFSNLEMPVMEILTEMERAGIIVDRDKLGAMKAELSVKADALHDDILKLAGRPFNPDSPKQLAEVLFTDMSLPVIKKTKSGPSTDSEVLEQLAGEYDSQLAAAVLEYRKLTKLISTYLVALAECINPATGRVHTSFHQASVITGRLSSSDPNLQNIPIQSPEGKKIRSAFIAADGCKLLAADYSQVELRILAHFCKDKTLRKAFAEDQDIHRIVASEVFGVPFKDVTPEMRARAKTVNFGIIYGQTGFGLARTLGIPRSEASAFIAEYKQRFPNIEDFLQECVKQARELGYVETLFGRRRKIPEIDSRNQQTRANAERTAINTVVQGSAADLIKQAMINVDKKIKQESLPAKMLLQIHDELIFEVETESVEKVKEAVVKEMTNAIKLDVPLKVDAGVGDNWMEAK